jgi:hypothetical protein
MYIRYQNEIYNMDHMLRASKTIRHTEEGVLLTFIGNDAPVFVPISIDGLEGVLLDIYNISPPTRLNDVDSFDGEVYPC